LVRDDVCGASVVEERAEPVAAAPLKRWFYGDSSLVKAARRRMVLGSFDGGWGRSVSGVERFEETLPSVS
jgi:molybdate-binding protein